MCAKKSVKVPEVSYEIRGTEETVNGMEGGPKRARENEKVELVPNTMLNDFMYSTANFPF